MITCLLIKNELKISINDRRKNYPYYQGSLLAKDLIWISEAPSYEIDDSDRELALNVLNIPVRKWQRPLIDEKINKMSLYFNSDETDDQKLPNLMPNPVLLASNRNSSNSLIIQPYEEIINNSTINIPNLFKLTINYNDKNNEKPLWVLDGQHRIKALSNSNQKNNPIPFVLLYDLSSNSVYRDSLFAKIFAEVTTGSTPLNYLHQEWLMRAFNLGDYALITHRNSIDTVLHLVSINNLSNLFGDNIEINPDLRDMDRIFDTNLLEMKQLIYNEYYKKISEGGPKKLNSKELALELINAVNILTVLIKAEKNVFFSEKKFRKKIVQQAFLIGCLAFLLKYIQFKQNKYTKTVNWDELFNKYNFSKINWNFNSWVSSLSGSLNTISFKIIKNCFVKMFTEFENHVTVELFNPNFVNFLQGNKAKVKIQLKKKQKSKIISKEELFDVPGVNSCLINDNKYFSISEETPNILIDKITNGDSSPANPKTYSKKKFCIIELNKDGIMHLIITLHLFGGIKKQLVLKLEKFD